MSSFLQWGSDTIVIFKQRFRKFLHELPQLPITQFYTYMWENDKWLLIKSLLVNYLLPLILELLP